MHRITVRHYRLIHGVVAVLSVLVAVLISRSESGFFHQFQAHLAITTVLVAGACVLLLRPPADLPPLKVPQLSRLQVRVVSGALLVLSVLSLGNYYLLNPGYFSPYKKEVLVASIVAMGLFSLLYAPIVDASKEGKSVHDDRAA